MKDILIRIKNRAKKLLWLIILLPILTGVIGYIVEAQQPVTYTASAEILLGNFENERYTDQKFVTDLLNSERYIKKIVDPSEEEIEEISEEFKEKLDKVNPKVSEIFGILKVSPLSTKKIVLSYTSSDQNRGKELLNLVTEYFLNESDVKHNNKVQLYTEIEERRAVIDPSTDALAYVKQLEIDEKVGINLTNLKDGNTILSEDVKVTVNQPNPMNRAILGFLLGIMINIIILVTPEIFREEKVRD